MAPEAPEVVDVAPEACSTSTWRVRRADESWTATRAADGEELTACTEEELRALVRAKCLEEAEATMPDPRATLVRTWRVTVRSTSAPPPPPDPSDAVEPASETPMFDLLECEG